MNARKPKQPVRTRKRVAPDPVSPPARAGARKPAKAVKKAASPSRAKTKPEKASGKKAKPEIVSNKSPCDPGRKSMYCPELRDRICLLVSEGVSWREIEKRGICSQYTMAVWLHLHADFAQQYNRAREARAEWIVAQIEGILESLDGDDTGHVAVNSARLKIETLKWQVSCYYPRMYGSKVRVDGSISHEHTAASSGSRRYDWGQLTQAECLALDELLEKATVKDEAV